MSKLAIKEITIKTFVSLTIAAMETEKRLFFSYHSNVAEREKYASSKI